MTKTFIEHVNITVTNPAVTAEMLENIFDWNIRWTGSGSSGGTTIHVGTDDHYLAVWSMNENYQPTYNGLNHIGVVVDDLDLIESRVEEQGLEPYHHGNYEPGRRFYFNDPDGIEFEVVSYS